MGHRGYLVSREMRQILAVCVLGVGCLGCWVLVHVTRTAYQQETAKLKDNKWWWAQCAKMDFYDKMSVQCNSLQVMSQENVHWAVVRRVVRVTSAGLYSKWGWLSCAVAVPVVAGIVQRSVMRRNRQYELGHWSLLQGSAAPDPDRFKRRFHHDHPMISRHRV
jgi:hypothetical protein